MPKRSASRWRAGTDRLSGFTVQPITHLQAETIGWAVVFLGASVGIFLLARSAEQYPSPPAHCSGRVCSSPGTLLLLAIVLLFMGITYTGLAIERMADRASSTHFTLTADGLTAYGLTDDAHDLLVSLSWIDLAAVHVAREGSRVRLGLELAPGAGVVGRTGRPVDACLEDIRCGVPALDGAVIEHFLRNPADRRFLGTRESVRIAKRTIREARQDPEKQALLARY